MVMRCIWRVLWCHRKDVGVIRETMDRIKGRRRQKLKYPKLLSQPNYSNKSSPPTATTAPSPRPQKASKSPSTASPSNSPQKTSPTSTPNSPPSISPSPSSPSAKASDCTKSKASPAAGVLSSRVALPPNPQKKSTTLPTSSPPPSNSKAPSTRPTSSPSSSHRYWRCWGRGGMGWCLGRRLVRWLDRCRGRVRRIRVRGS